LAVQSLQGRITKRFGQEYITKQICRVEVQISVTQTRLILKELKKNWQAKEFYDIWQLDLNLYKSIKDKL